MDSTMILVIVGVAALIAGIVAGKLIFAKNTQHKVQEAEQQAQKIIGDAQANAEILKKQY